MIDLLVPQIHGPNATFPTPLAARAKCIQADIAETKSYESELKGLDAVIHLAAQTGKGQSMYELATYVRDNVLGTARLLDGIAGMKQKPAKILLASSRAVYGEGRYQTQEDGSVFHPQARSASDLSLGIWGIHQAGKKFSVPMPMTESQTPMPVSVYGHTKLWQEELVSRWCSMHSSTASILRLQNVYGPGQSPRNPYTGILAVFATALLRKQSVELFEDGKMTRDFVFVDDVAKSFLQVLERSPSNPILNIGSATSVTLFALVLLMGKILNIKTSINVSGRARVGDIRHAVADITQMRSDLKSISLTSLAEDLTRTKINCPRQESNL